MSCSIGLTDYNHRLYTAQLIMRNVDRNTCACNTPLRNDGTGTAHLPNMYCTGTPTSVALMSVEDAKDIIAKHYAPTVFHV